MMKLLLAAAASLILATATHASEVKFPSDEPVATINVPDGWTVKPQEDGSLDVSSPEDSVYVGIEAAENKDAKASIEEWGVWMREQGVKPDDATRKDTESTINGMPYYAIDADGTDKDGKISIFFAALQINKTHQVTFVYWAAKDEQEPYLPALREMMRSVKALP